MNKKIHQMDMFTSNCGSLFHFYRQNVKQFLKYYPWITHDIIGLFVSLSVLNY